MCLKFWTPLRILSVCACERKGMFELAESETISSVETKSNNIVSYLNWARLFVLEKWSCVNRQVLSTILGAGAFPLYWRRVICIGRRIQPNQLKQRDVLCVFHFPVCFVVVVLFLWIYVNWLCSFLIILKYDY